MTGKDMGWAIPLMQAGYTGRGLVYLAVAGISLYSIWHGGAAQDTSSALGWLEGTWAGAVVLFLILLGMLAYAIWRALDAVFDLECYGSDGKGIVARAGMFVTGGLHLGIGLVAFSLLFGGGGSEEGSGIPQYVGAVMQWPGGRWIIGLVAVIIMAAGAHYLRQGWKATYRQHLRASRFTTRWNPVLRAGVIAHGVVIGVIGLLFMFAALRADPQAAGGVGEAFSWLSGQLYGRLLVISVCVGLAGFAIFCFVNAVFRIVPRASGPDVQTLAARLAG